jgi:hypothetical protein
LTAPLPRLERTEFPGYSRPVKGAFPPAVAGLLAAAAMLCSACSGMTTAEAGHRHRPHCPSSWRAGWQKLAKRIHAPVYCPGWLPSPLTGNLHGTWSTGADVGHDRSYLAGFIWVEHGDEVHVNLRGYPGRTSTPGCVNEERAGTRTVRTEVPCFADPKWTKRIDGTPVTFYTVNRDADQWHLLFAWRKNRSLYALSEHVAPPFSYSRVLANMRHMFRSLVWIRPRA